MSDGLSQRPHRQLSHEDHLPGNQTFPISVVAQDVVDPANIGSLFRLADALGVRHLYLAGESVTPDNKKVRRAARSAQQAVSWSYHQDPVELVQTLKARNVWIVSLEITNNSEDVRHVRPPPDRDIVLVVGAENAGVRQTILDASDRVVHIPMRGVNSSMNLAVATALAVFEITRQLTLGS